ncbi:MAG: UDP-glucose 4-epimerase [Candidatus Anoxychlamydiales bacterium]|nr:UDP-glucose 4-epimerase [Candidatus Anoxychlamydiales bacterium]
MSQNIIVTGGAGYIGSHMCKVLKEKNYHPITIDNLSTGHKESVKYGDFIQGDIKDYDLLIDTFKKYNPIGVMHFAACAIVSESMEDPKKYYSNNTSNTINLLNAMIEANIKNIIFSSTCATYGIPQFTPLTEDHPTNPISPYGQSKLMIEKILKDYSKAYSLNYAALRYFNAAGADIDLDIGEKHEMETHLIPIAIETALNVRDILNVYGCDFETKDKTAIRDYIHVLDLASAHIKALEYIQKNNKSITLNLGTENGFSVLEVVDMVEKISGKKLKIKLTNKREGDPAKLFANANLAKKLLNWELKHSSLETIVNTAYRWHQKQQKVVLKK